MIMISIIGDNLEDLIGDFIHTLWAHDVLNLEGMNSGDGDCLEQNIYNVLKRYENE